MTEGPVHDDFFSRMMSRGKLTISDDDFERDLIKKIEQENWKQRFFAKNRILSILFLCWESLYVFGSLVILSNPCSLHWTSHFKIQYF